MTPQVVEAEPTFTVKYTGKGKWNVVKVCSINPEWDGAWYLDEHTGEFVWNKDYYEQAKPSPQ